jgi:phosphohistidine phosphatase
MSVKTMRRLLLLRHAKADWPHDVVDHQRPLAAAGVAAASLMGAYLVQEKLVPELALVSTSTRTRETWALLKTALRQDIAVVFEPRIYEAHPADLLQAIRDTPDTVHTLLLVGHNPGIHSLALQLIARGNPDARESLQYAYPPAGLAVVDFKVPAWSNLAIETGFLERFVTPKTVALTAS